MDSVVTCESDSCRGTAIKEKFCEDGIFAKIVFFTENEEKFALTIFREEIKVLDQQAETSSSEDIRKVLIRSS